jgi:hypothetical protein
VVLAAGVATAVPGVRITSAQPPVKDDAEEQSDASPREREHAALHVRYAEARVRLAQADLEKARDLNRKHPNAVPAGEVKAIEDRMALLETLARDARDRPHGNGLSIQRASSRAAAARAQAALESARAARRIADNAVTDIDMTRLELRVEVTRLRADLWDDPVMVPSLIDEMQVQIEQLHEQVQDLSDQMEILRSRTTANP